MAITMARSDWLADDENHFSPLSTYSPVAASRTAVAVMARASEPATSSVIA